jgi:PAS domain S-box-containing protein
LVITIADRKKEEEKVRKSEEKFRKASMSSPDLISISRLTDGMMMSVNEAFCKILGYSEEEVIGKTSFELNLWVDQEIRKKVVTELHERGRVDNFEIIILKKDGSKIDGLFAASLIEIGGVTHILNVTKDISLRKRVEEKLAHEQFLVNAMMDNLPDHIYFKDLESRFIRVNNAQARFLGLDHPDQAIGKTDFDFFTEEHARMAFEDEKAIIKTGHPLAKEERLAHPDRPDTWVYATKLPLLNNEGNIIGTFGISRDITEQKKAEEQIILLAYALESINDCVSITDLADKVLFLNDSFLKTYGYKKGELEGKAISIIRSADNPYEIVREILPATIRGGWHGELLNRKKDGSEFQVFLSTSVIKNNQGQPVALIGVANDITIRKRMELEEHILNEINKGVTTTSNLDELLKLIHQSLSKVVYAENCFVALHNPQTGLFSFPYFVDKFDTVPQPTTLGMSCSAYVFRTGKPFLFTTKLFNKLKEQNEIELVGSPSPSWIGIPLQTPSKVIGVLVLQHYEKENVYSERDVDFLVSIGSHIARSIERKKAEEEIKLKNEQFQLSDAEKDKFFSIIAHDLRGPLSAFVGATQIITEEIQTMSVEEIKEITLSMKISASNIYHLLENLLEWSRLKRGGMDFSPERINLKEEIAAAVDVLSESALKKKIELTYSIPSEMFVFADNHMFDTVIRNLVSNAIKFTPTGGKVTASAVYDNDHSIEISVRDSGIGMTKELKDKLFMINEKTNRNGTEGELSTGLGLLLCKDFIEKHDGRIWVESEVGKGSTFSFTIGNFKIPKQNYSDNLLS